MISTLRINYSESMHASSRNILSNEIPQVPCIYFCRNSINGKYYVGKTTNLRKRILTHFQKINKGVINRFYSAILHYGTDSFVWGILETTGISTLCERESFWIHRLDSYNKGYNMTDGGDGGSTTKGRYWINKNGKNRMVSNTDVYVREGWNLGRDITTNMHKGTVAGRFRIYKDNDFRIILPDELPLFESLGYKRGDPRRTNPTTQGTKRMYKEGLPAKFVKKDLVQSFIDEGWIIYKDYLKSC